MQLKLRAVDVIFQCIVLVPPLAISRQKHKYSTYVFGLSVCPAVCPALWSYTKSLWTQCCMVCLWEFHTIYHLRAVEDIDELITFEVKMSQQYQIWSCTLGGISDKTHVEMSPNLKLRCSWGQMNWLDLKVRGQVTAGLMV